MTTITKLGNAFVWANETDWFWTDNESRAPLDSRTVGHFAEVDADGNHVREWFGKDEDSELQINPAYVR